MSTITSFFNDVLGAPLANSRWSWGAVDHERRRLFLRVWRDELKQDGEGNHSIQVLRHAQARSRPGWNERVRHLDLLRSGYRGFGVLCDRHQPDASTIAKFEKDQLLVLGALSDNDVTVRAAVMGTVESFTFGEPPEVGLAADLASIAAAPLDETSRKALVDARLGQGRYRLQLLKVWGNACAVTGCSVQAALRASHCKPWRDSDNRERLDADNGLLLMATLDALFDAGLIAFSDDGAMLVSSVLSWEERGMLGIPSPLRLRPKPGQRVYLKHHRERLFVD